MILAAGRGERMRPLTDACPKPLLPVNGKPLIEHHIERLAAAGFADIVINTGWLGERLPATLGDGSRWQVKLHFSHEGWPALETGGGIFHALPLLGNAPFLVINGDVWTDWQPIAKLPHSWRSHTLAHLMLVTNPPHHPHGDFGLQGDLVQAEGESRLTFSGIAYYHPDFFASCLPGPFKLAPLLYSLARQARIDGELITSRWYDIGTIERLAELDKLLAAER